MFLIKRLWTRLATPLPLSQNMISPLEILTILILVHMVYFQFLPIHPADGGWTRTCEWFSSGAGVGSIGLIWIARAVYVGVGVAATATIVGGVIIAFAGGAMIGIAIVYVIREITKESPVLR